MSKKDTVKKDTVKSEPNKPYQIVGDSIKINENLSITMDGRGRTIKLTDEIAENLLAKDKAKYSNQLTRG